MPCASTLRKLVGMVEEEKGRREEKNREGDAREKKNREMATVRFGSCFSSPETTRDANRLGL